MNHCFDCNSAYSEPGTCNCFAPGGKRELRGVWTSAPERWPRTFSVCSGCGQVYEHGTGFSHICPSKSDGLKDWVYLSNNTSALRVDR